MPVTQPVIFYNNRINIDCKMKYTNIQANICVTDSPLAFKKVITCSLTESRFQHKLVCK